MPARPPLPVAPDPGTHLRLFGAPGVWRGDQPVRLTVKKTLALLAFVAIEGDTSRSRLAELLWGGASEIVGRRNLRHALHRLRAAGLDDVVLADDETVSVRGLTHDLQTFDRAVADGHLAQAGQVASGVLIDGLDLPDAPAFAEWVDTRRAQFSRSWRAAMGQHAQQLEDSGDRAAALAIRQQLVDDDVLQESCCIELMRLHAELGDRAAALLAYQRLHDALRTELGIAPSAACQTLARKLRARPEAATRLVDGAAEPAAGLPWPEPPGQPAAALPSGLRAQPPFIARGQVQAQIEAAWAIGQRVYLHGVAGTGKTRLASELAASRGAWLRVACEPQDGELPYSSIVRLLRAAREAAPDVDLPAWVRRELAQLMPELGQPPDALPTDEARQRLLAAVAHGWQVLVHDNFQAVVLDDWHWCDSASVDLWAGLAPVANDPAGASAVAWIVSHRSGLLPPAALKRQRADVDAGRGQVVALGDMDGGEMLALVQALSGSQGAQRFARRLHDATAGNPFFVLETLRHLFGQRLLVADGAGWRTPFDDLTRDYAELPVPPSVHAAVQARARALGTPVQRILEMASLASGRIDARLLAGAGQLDEGDVVSALEHAQAAQLLLETPGRQGGWQFAHDVVRQALRHSLSSARTRLLHERLAGQLERSGAAPALVASQWEAADQPAVALAWRIKAAEAARRAHALNEALSHYGQALADGAVGAGAVAIHLACAHLHAVLQNRLAADAAFDAALACAAQAAVSGESTAASAGGIHALQIQLVRAEHLVETDREPAARALLAALATQVEKAGPALRSRAAAVMGNLLMREGRHGEAQALLQQALDWLEGLPDAGSQVAALLLDQARTSHRNGDGERWGDLAQRAVVAYQAIDEPHGLAQALTQLGAHRLHAGQQDDGVAISERARELARRGGLVGAHRAAIVNLVERAFDVGDADRAIELLDEGDALGPVFDSQHMEMNFVAARCHAHLLRGELAPARRAAERLLAVADAADQPMLRINNLHVVIELQLLTDDLDGASARLAEAQAHCDALQASGEGNACADQHHRLVAWLALLQGRASQALDQLPPESDLPTALRDRCEAAWIGCAAARALGDLEGARRRLCSVELDDDVGGTLMVLWLIQRLGLAAECGQDDAPGALKARDLLSAGKVPAVLAQRLVKALDALPIRQT